MRRFPFVLTIVFLFSSVLLSGCDTAGSDRDGDREALVGTWTLDDVAFNYYLTAETNQSVIDPDEAGDGQIVVSGAVDTELRYLRRTLFFFEPLVVASAEPLHLVGEFAAEVPRLRSALEREGDFTFLTSDVLSGGFSAPTSGSLRFEASTNTLRASEAVLSDEIGDGETVTLGGTLQAATQPLAAGEETLVETATPEGTVVGSLTFAFDEDGTFTAQSADEEGEAEETRGTWRVEDGELVLDAETGDPVLSEQRIRFDVGSDLLRMKDLSAFDTAADSLASGERQEALGVFERAYGAAAGSLSRVRGTQDLLLRPGGEEEAAAQVPRKLRRSLFGFPWLRDGRRSVER